jgi:hypothetical protein
VPFEALRRLLVRQDRTRPAYEIAPAPPDLGPGSYSVPSASTTEIEPSDNDADLRGGLVPHSSRQRPGDVRKRWDGWGIESADQGPDSAIAAGNEIGPENTL